MKMNKMHIVHNRIVIIRNVKPAVEVPSQTHLHHLPPLHVSLSPRLYSSFTLLRFTCEQDESFGPLSLLERELVLVNLYSRHILWNKSLTQTSSTCLCLLPLLYRKYIGEGFENVWQTSVLSYCLWYLSYWEVSQSAGSFPPCWLRPSSSVRRRQSKQQKPLLSVHESLIPTSNTLHILPVYYIPAYEKPPAFIWKKPLSCEGFGFWHFCSFQRHAVLKVSHQWYQKPAAALKSLLYTNRALPRPACP